MEPNFSNSDKIHYSFVPKFDQDTTIYTSVGIPEVKIKEITTRQEAEQFTLALSSVACKRYADDGERPQVYRWALKSGDCVELASMIKEVSKMGQCRREKGKPLSIRERDGVKSARRSLFGELSIALDICPEEIPDCIIS